MPAPKKTNVTRTSVPEVIVKGAQSALDTLEDLKRENDSLRSLLSRAERDVREARDDIRELGQKAARADRFEIQLRRCRGLLSDMISSYSLGHTSAIVIHEYIRNINAALDADSDG